METRFKDLPQDTSTLQKMVMDLIQEKEALESKNEHLLYQLLKSLKHQYGKKSEKSNNGQLEFVIFDEAADDNEEEVVQADEEITIASHTRKKSGRKPLPKDLPREQVIHDLLPDHKICSCGHALHKIGEDKSEQLEYIPAKIKVI